MFSIFGRGRTPPPTNKVQDDALARHEAALLEERERIVKALNDEADMTPYGHGAAGLRDAAWLVSVNFKYDEEERMRVSEEHNAQEAAR